VNKRNFPVLIYSTVLVFFVSGCSSTKLELSDDIRVLMSSETLIRFAYQRRSDALSQIQNYAVQQCSSFDKQAVKGVQTCDGERCEIAYFCEECR